MMYGYADKIIGNTHNLLRPYARSQPYWVFSTVLSFANYDLARAADKDELLEEFIKDAVNPELVRGAFELGACGPGIRKIAKRATDLVDVGRHIADIDYWSERESFMEWCEGCLTREQYELVCEGYDDERGDRGDYMPEDWDDEDWDDDLD